MDMPDQPLPKVARPWAHVAYWTIIIAWLAFTGYAIFITIQKN